MISSSRLTGFRNLEIDARHELLIQTTGLESTALDVLRPERGLTLEQVAHMIENAVGVLGIPLGIALNFTINGRDFLVPMATEEPSVIAAASNAARIAELRSVTPAAVDETIGSSKSDPLANDYGYSA